MFFAVIDVAEGVDMAVAVILLVSSDAALSIRNVTSCVWHRICSLLLGAPSLATSCALCSSSCCLLRWWLGVEWDFASCPVTRLLVLKLGGNEIRGFWRGGVGLQPGRSACWEGGDRV